MEDAHKNTFAARDTAEPAAAALAETRRRVGEWLEAPRIQRGIIALVVINAITLGLGAATCSWRWAPPAYPLKAPCYARMRWHGISWQYLEAF